PLYYGLSKVTATQFKMNEFASGANYMYSRLFVATNQYKLESYYTTVGTVYYQLTNRKVTENFVDTNGVKITAPTGFTQGKKQISRILITRLRKVGRYQVRIKQVMGKSTS
ncbi:hypothetical protein ACTPG1_002487, partial [Enterococcus faecalis]